MAGTRVTSKAAAPRGRMVDTAELETAVGLWLRLAQQQELRALSRMFSEYGMSQVLFAILLVVASNPGCRQADLEAPLRIRQPNLVEPIEALITRGLMLREPDPADRRAQTLTLTAKGETLLAELRGVHDRLIDGYRKQMGAQNYDRLVGLLKTFVED